MRSLKAESRYILFTQKEHDAVKFDFTQEQIATFVEMWEYGHSIQKIAERLKTSNVSVVLIAMDLEMAGTIEPREGGLLGKNNLDSLEDC